MERIGDALRYLRVDLTVLLAQWVRGAFIRCS